MPILWKKMLFKNVEIHFLNKKENYELKLKELINEKEKKIILMKKK